MGSGIDRHGDVEAPGASLLARGRELPSAVAAEKAAAVLRNAPARGVPRVLADGGVDEQGRLTVDVVVDGVEVRYPEVELLTVEERRAWEALAAAALLVMQLPALHPADIKETARDFHCLQNRVLARAAYPVRYREGG